MNHKVQHHHTHQSHQQHQHQHQHLSPQKALSTITLPSLLPINKPNDKTDFFSTSLPNYHYRSMNLFQSAEPQKVYKKYQSVFYSPRDVVVEAPVPIVKAATFEEEEAIRKEKRRYNLLRLAKQSVKPSALQILTTNIITEEADNTQLISTKHNTAGRILSIDAFMDADAKMKNKKKQKDVLEDDEAEKLLAAPLPKVQQRKVFSAGEMTTSKKNTEEVKLDDLRDDYKYMKQRRQVNMMKLMQTTKTTLNTDDVHFGLSSEKWNEYFGDQSKNEFYRIFRQSSRNYSQYPNDEEVPKDMNTPRSKYMREVEKTKSIPIPILLRNENVRPLGCCFKFMYIICNL